jgi:hypothetical protein
MSCRFWRQKEDGNLQSQNRAYGQQTGWDSGAYKVIRVTRDRALHDALCGTYYALFYEAMCNGTGPPKFAKGEKDLIREMVEDSRNAHMDVGEGARWTDD